MNGVTADVEAWLKADSDGPVEGWWWVHHGDRHTVGGLECGEYEPRCLPVTYVHRLRVDSAVVTLTRAVSTADVHTPTHRTAVPRPTIG